jgi:hypothetical protein
MVSRLRTDTGAVRQGKKQRFRGCRSVQTLQMNDMSEHYGRWVDGGWLAVLLGGRFLGEESLNSRMLPHYPSFETRRDRGEDGGLTLIDSPI